MALRAAGRTRLAGMASQGGSTGRPSGLRAAQATGRREYTKQINLNKKASTAAFTGAKRYLFCSYLLLVLRIVPSTRFQVLVRALSV